MPECQIHCAVPLAPYACLPENSRGRAVFEPESAYRTCFGRDRDRIIHSSAFRRLNLKAQVFEAGGGDHYRTRLTHSLEVAQVARTLARALYVNEDLAEAIALAHDLGHPPFAHRGEDALAVCMAPYGGFKHNDQTVRVLTKLEKRYPDFDGLNLCYETLEGLVKHNGPALKEGMSINDLPFTIKELSKEIDFQLSLHAHLEAQIVDLADDTAYFNHDVEDGIRAGFFSLNDLNDLEIYADILPERRRALAHHPERILISEMIRAQFGAMIMDVMTTTRDELQKINPQTPMDIRRAGRQIVRFSADMFRKVKELREFLYARMYKSAPLVQTAREAALVIETLFAAYSADPGQMPEFWEIQAREARDSTAQARIVADYIAGMTDRFARVEYERVILNDPALRSVPR